MVGLVDALDLAQRGQEIQIFCLGTCPMPAGERIARGAVHRGLLEWKFGGEAAGLGIDAQQFAFDHRRTIVKRSVAMPSNAPTGAARMSCCRSFQQPHPDFRESWQHLSPVGSVVPVA
jgi:hypothetical protein